MHENCIEFVVEFCREKCPTWAHCIATAKGFDKGDKRDKEDILFCLKSIESPEKSEEEIEKEIKALEGLVI